MSLTNRPGGRLRFIIFAGGAGLLAGALTLAARIVALPVWWPSEFACAPNTAKAGLIAAGLGIFAWAWLAPGGAGQIRPWPPAAVGAAGIILTFHLAYAASREAHYQSLIPAFCLIGIVLSALVAVMTAFALSARRRAATLQAEIGERGRVEKELAGSEERFRTAFEQAPYGMCLASLDGRLLQVSAAFCQLLKRTPEEVLAGGWAQFTHKDDLGVSREAADRLIRGEIPSMEFEKRYLDRDGEVVWVQIKTLLLRDHEGAPSHFVTHVMDIGGRKRAEMALRHREELFRAAFEYAPYGLALAGPEGIFQVNSTLCQMLGYSEEQLLARNWKQITAPDDRHLVPSAARRLLAEHPPWVEVEKRYLHARGGIVWARVRLSLLPEGAGGWHIVAHIEDITERKQAEEAIRASEERVRLLLDSTAEAIYGIDLEGNCTFANPACLKMLGYTDAEAIIGKNIHELIHHTRADGSPYPLSACRHFAAFRKGLGVHADDEVLWRADGSSFPAEYWSHPVSNDGRVVGSVVAFLDITERKATEQELIQAKEGAEAASLAKSRFLANMSHEIRTPMNGVIGMTRLLLDTDLSPEQRRYAAVVRDCSESLKSLLDHILDLSKIEAGKMVLEHAAFDLRQMLEGVVEMLAIQANHKGLELTCLVSPDAPSLLRGDPCRLRQVIVNLAANAIKFTEAGDVAIRVQVASQDETRIGLRFSIRDTGIGIPAGRAEALFSPFVQADVSTTRKYGGTGLGLSISKQLVELMGGRIGVESEPDVGSTFWFTLDLEKQAGADLAVEIAMEAAAVIIDARAANREVVGTLLGSWGYRVYQSDGAAAGVEMLREAAGSGQVAVAVVDEEAIAREIAADPLLAGTAIVLMSPLGDRLPASPKLAGTRIVCVSKPIVEARLRLALAEALGRPPAAAPEERAAVRPLKCQAELADRILLAEDNPVNRQVLRSMLGRQGLTVCAVSNGAEAVRALQSEDFSLVLMDCEMPELDGYEATSRIRDPQTGARNPRIPVIAVTASALPGDREYCLRCGMDDYLSKPIDQEKLLAVLAKYLPAWAISTKPALSPGTPQPSAAPAQH